MINLPVKLSFLMDLKFKCLGKSVHNGNAHPMKTPGNLIEAVVELSPGMKNREDYFGSRPFLFSMDPGRNSTAVVHDRNGMVRMNRYIDMAAKSCKSFINGVIDKFVHKMMESINACAADIHTRPYPNGLKTLQNPDLFGSVCNHFFFWCHNTPCLLLL
jgi:hypothetical protein